MHFPFHMTWSDWPTVALMERTPATPKGIFAELWGEPMDSIWSHTLSSSHLMSLNSFIKMFIFGELIPPFWSPFVQPSFVPSHHFLRFLERQILSSRMRMRYCPMRSLERCIKHPRPLFQIKRFCENIVGTQCNITTSIWCFMICMFKFGVLWYACSTLVHKTPGFILGFNPVFANPASSNRWCWGVTAMILSYDSGTTSRHFLGTSTTPSYILSAKMSWRRQYPVASMVMALKCFEMMNFGSQTGAALLLLVGGTAAWWAAIQFSLLQNVKWWPIVFFGGNWNLLGYKSKTVE